MSRPYSIGILDAGEIEYRKAGTHRWLSDAFLVAVASTVRAVEDDGWLVDTRASYDTVAESYADSVRGLIEASTYVQAVFELFARLIQADGGGPVVDVGCGPGQVTAHLRALGLDAAGIDLSPAMVKLASDTYPGVRFDVASMTALPLAEHSVVGLVAWYSIIHVPDGSLNAVLNGFGDALRPGGLLLLGFHVGEGTRLKSEGYGGHPMHVYVHRRRLQEVSDRLGAAGFTVEAEIVLRSNDSASDGGVILARSS